nr:MAG TPA: hypothetical protein [Caudoviricetes sp.]
MGLQFFQSENPRYCLLKPCFQGCNKRIRGFQS